MLSQTWTSAVEGVAQMLPKVLIGVLIVAVGLILGRLLRALTLRFFVALRLHRMSDRIGVSAFFARGDARYTVAEVLATIVYWLVLMLALQTMGWVLGLEGLVNFFGQVLNYLPRLVVAAVIVLVGTALGAFFGGAIQIATANSGLRVSRPLARMVKYAIVFFSVALALEDLEIATRLLTITFLIIVGSMGVAFALAFGLGCRDLARSAVEKWLGAEQPPDSGANTAEPGRPAGDNR